MVTMADNSTASYVGWEEVVVSGERGRREVHYYLKRGGGGGDLVVVGKEKSARHMSYRYAFKGNDSLLSNLKRFSVLKLRCRREVIDWLNSLLSGERADGSLTQGMETKSDLDIIKDVQMPKLGQYKTEFTWLGSPWTCRKRRSHYQSFCRNGVIISAQDFVYVLAEEGKRLVAYLDDMYEDTRGNKMVVVRWFHKIDEVDFVLPHDYNDREVFFSLCLQDLSIECIDGLATVLSPEHYKKFINEATLKGLVPFVCYRQFDNDDVKPFDITRIKGYWKQEILRKRASSSLELPDNGLKVESRPKKRIRWSEECDLYIKSDDKRETAKSSVQMCGGSNLDSRGGMKTGSLKEDSFNASLSDQAIPTCGQYLTIGSEIEVLSQDSGIRGCWFRASIIKKHKDKVKVRYQDVKDAVDGSENLEEWILASRLASPDALGIRVSGRTMVRPTPLSQKNKGSCVVNVGSIVDAWWNDGWWEGIVVKKESEDRLNVYFPGEKREMTFSPGDMRRSKEWFDNRWQSIKGRPQLVSTIYGINKCSDIDQVGAPIANKDLGSIHNDDPLQKPVKIGDSMTNSDEKTPNDSQFVRDLSKDYLLARLRWKSSGKRRRGRSPLHRAQFSANSIDDTGIQTLEKFFVNSKFDQDNCKYARDSHFGSSAASPLTNLVMSR
ncbi:hypothetical protein BUALT_Bualt17G0096500 [Buddleja alternifolia]|uniref:BAH domain-containing protein n=1 Tax=Buddleja alternifolia TaxID=168488 RepID=A0AAV6W7D8_9LAMI|nr:hypothetical protein BUALT_Bualt17G0096500 [Buddleja alternifolia]